MWTWSLNWGQITPEIIIGTCPMTSKDLERIHSETGVSGVLSLQHDDCLSYWRIDYDELKKTADRLRIEMVRCPIIDFDVPDMRRNLPKAVSSLAYLITQGHKTFIHCTAGLGRAPLTVLAYLIWLKTLQPDDAIRRILNGRPGAVPAWEALYGSREDMIQMYRPNIEKYAYILYQQSINNNSESDWIQAEDEVLKSALLSGDFSS